MLIYKSMKCLVTKIKASMSSKLSKLGEIKTKSNARNNIGYYLKVYGSKSDNCVISAKALSEGTTIGGATSIDGSTQWTTSIVGTVPIEISWNKYKTEAIYGGGYTISDLKSESLKSIQYFANNQVDAAITGNIEDCYLPNLIALDIEYQSRVYGNITSLGISYKIELMKLAGTSITGNIEELAQKIFENGRTSGSLEIKCNKYLTLNGSLVGNGTSKIINFSTSGWTVS